MSNLQFITEGKTPAVAGALPAWLRLDHFLNRVVNLLQVIPGDVPPVGLNSDDIQADVFWSVDIFSDLVPRGYFVGCHFLSSHSVARAFARLKYSPGGSLVNR